MIFNIDKASKVPAYCQIADWIEVQIEAGDIREGERLPAERKLGLQTGAARNTVKRAYEELAKRGRIKTEQSSGSYVISGNIDKKVTMAEGVVLRAIQRLRDNGLSWHETEHMFLSYIWNHLPETEKIKLAWVDCSIEILQDTAAAIEKSCNVRVTPLLYDAVLEDSSLLTNGDYDVAATTANHFDEIRRSVEKNTGAPVGFNMDMVVFGISPMSVSQIVKIESDMSVVVVYEREWYRYSIERYLQEFSVKGKIQYVALGAAMDYLERNKGRQAVILPQDFSYGGGVVRDIYKYCVERDIFCFAFQQVIDDGSLTYLKKHVQALWMGLNGL